MYAELMGYIDSVKNTYLNQLLHSFFDDGAFSREFKFHSAAKSVHHGFVGGLLEHTVSVTRNCNYFAQNYPFLNRDLLLCAAIFHDVGKLKELSTFPENDYTDAGQLLGHIMIGAEWVGGKSVRSTDSRRCWRTSSSTAFWRITGSWSTDLRKSLRSWRLWHLALPIIWTRRWRRCGSCSVMWRTTIWHGRGTTGCWRRISGRRAADCRYACLEALVTLHVLTAMVSFAAAVVNYLRYRKRKSSGEKDI